MLIPFNGFADDVYYKYKNDNNLGYFMIATYPEDCELIIDINKDYESTFGYGSLARYTVKNREVLSDMARQCKLYITGKTVSDGAKNTAKAAKELAEEAYEKSGAKALFEGLFGKDD